MGRLSPIVPRRAPVRIPTSDYECDARGKNKLRRLLGAGAAVVFKGSGFYQTDYRSDSYRTAAEADKKSSAPAAEASGSSKSEGSSSATPAPKSEGGEKTGKAKKK